MVNVKTSHYKVRVDRAGGCRQKTYLKLFSFDFDGIEPQFYWNSCPCNEYDALIRRHLLGSITGFNGSSTQAFRGLEMNLFRLYQQLDHFGPVTDKTLLENTRSTIKRRYKRALVEIRTREINLDYSRASRVKAFVKYEKVPWGKYESGKPPRLIQYRDFKYLYLLKKELLGFALQVKERKCRYNDQLLSDILTKTHDNRGCARVLRESWDSFSDPVALLLDHSKFDGHVCPELLELEHKFWRGLNPSRRLKLLLQSQLLNKCYTSNGISYTCKAGRMSGEYTTSDGNSILNIAMLITWSQMVGLGRVRIHVNGDDSVVVCERPKAHLDLGLFRNFNMECECSGIVDDFRQISYCQASPVRVKSADGYAWYMVKEPLRSISRLQYAPSLYARVVDRYMAGVGLCELACSQAIPVTQWLALWLISQGRPLGSVDKIPALSSGNDSSYCEPDMVTRVDYEVAFGITIQQQFELEALIAGSIRSAQDLNNNLTKYKNFIRN